MRIYVVSDTDERSKMLMYEFIELLSSNNELDHAFILRRVVTCKDMEFNFVSKDTNMDGIHPDAKYSDEVFRSQMNIYRKRKEMAGFIHKN